MTVEIGVDSGSGTCSYERPDYVGRVVGPDDFDDCWLAVRFSNRDGAILNTAPDGLVIIPGDQLELDIRLPAPASGAVTFPPTTVPFLHVAGLGPGGSGTWSDDTARTAAKLGFDLKFLAGPWLSDVPVVDLTSGIEVAFGDKLPVADNQWYHMVADLSPFVNLTLDRYAVVCAMTGIFRYVVDLRNVFITNRGVGRYGIFIGFANTTYQGIEWYYDDGYYGGSLVRAGLEDIIVLDSLVADHLQGTYASPGAVIAIGTTYTASPLVGTLYNNSPTGNMTVTLYAASAVPAGQRLTLINLHATKTLTVSRAGADTIDGATTKGPFGQYLGITLESDGVSVFHKVP